MSTIEEDICEAVCQAMGLSDDDQDRLDDRALVWEFCEHFINALERDGFVIRALQD